MRTVTYYKDVYMKESFTVGYDEEASCMICNEPVISASVGGTVICPSCDCGNCRYCHATIFVIKEEIDGGTSKREVLEHMAAHRNHQPEWVEELNNAHRRINAIFDAKKRKVEEVCGK